MTLFKVNLAQIGYKGVLESSGALSGGDACSSLVPIGVPDLGKNGTGPKPISEPGEARAGPTPVEPLNDPFVNLDRVEDIAKEDSPRSPIEII